MEIFSFPGLPPPDARSPGPRTDPAGQTGVGAEPERPARPQAASESSSGANYAVRLRVDEQTGQVIAVVTDRNTGAVIHEIPPEEMRVAAQVIRNLLGPLVDRLA